jgi:RNA polymerase sigma factor (sigma-70 family)
MSKLQATGKSGYIINSITGHGRGLFNFIKGKVANKADAEDVLQDVWMQLSNVDDEDEIGNLKGWLYRVANNRIIDKARKKTELFIDDLVSSDADNEENVDFTDILLPDSDDPESVYLKELFWEELFAALDELPEKQKEVFIQNELEDKTLRQIADESGEKLKTIISRKGYAVKHLRNRLRALFDEFLAY